MIATINRSHKVRFDFPKLDTESPRNSRSFAIIDTPILKFDIIRNGDLLNISLEECHYLSHDCNHHLLTRAPKHEIMSITSLDSKKLRSIEVTQDWGGCRSFQCKYL